MDAEERANELYWGSDRSVNQIAEDLDLSKGALYEMIRPIPAGLACPDCGAELVHSNRTAKERARVDCTSCGWDGTEDQAAGPTEERSGRSASESSERGSGPLPDVEPVDDIYPADDYDSPGPPPKRVVEREADARRMVAGGALLGAAVGLALVIWARRR